MVRNGNRRLCFSILTLLFSLSTSAQINGRLMLEFLSGDSFNKDSQIVCPAQVREFYIYSKYQAVWIQPEDSARLKTLLDEIQSSGKRGFDEKDYQYKFLQAFRNKTFPLVSTRDSLRSEVLLTDAAIHYYRDIAFGNTIPALNYSGINYSPQCLNVPKTMIHYILTDSISFLEAAISPHLPEIKPIEEKIRWMTEVVNDRSFREVRITSEAAVPGNLPLLRKLHQLGITEPSTPKNALIPRIKKVRSMFSLPETGNLDKSFIRELNVPVRIRLKQLNLALNYYRWLACLTENHSVIVVNIPAAYMKVYKKQVVILEMRMVVGKPSTPTIPMISEVYEVIAYPYWYVPKSIVIGEILPAVKRNISYLETNNYQVLSREGKIMNPYSVNWSAMNRNYFPYTIRQATGCDNSLGLLKLNFYNLFGAYLHDTNSKNLFNQSRRFFSHGCMRMEKPVELGHLILNNNKIAIDTLTEKGCLKSQSPVIIPADVKMPVIVWYNPVDIDSSGNVLFFEDVYKKFNRGK